MIKIFLAVLLVANAGAAFALPDREKFINDLVGRMTLQEKFGQLQQLDGEADGRARAEHYDLARKGLLGSTLNVRGSTETNKLQQAAMESRLHIPLLFGFDVIHGYRTIFPVPIGGAAAFDPGLVEQAASAAAAEARACGVRWTFSPMVDIARDPRWGRMVEGAGEDTYLGSVLAAAQVRGYQGGDYSRPDKVAACAKHWAAYGAAEAGRDYNTSEVSERTLRDVYFPPFKAAADAGAATFMSAFADLDGVPGTANSWLIRDVLKGEWKFGGFVVSDYTSVAELIKHGIAADGAGAARAALNAGVDMEMVSRLYAENGPELVAKGLVTMAQVDEAVSRILRIKARAGLFDDPYTPAEGETGVLLKPEYLDLSRELAERSFVLLKNDAGTLPVAGRVKKVLLTGALASDKAAMLGPWSGDGNSADAVSISEGLSARAARSGVSVQYMRGAGPTADPSDDVDAAAKAAVGADLVIAVVGEDPSYMSGEASSRANLTLSGRQREFLKALAAAGKPLAVLIVSGRPLDISGVIPEAGALLQLWFPGTMAGTAVAAVLFGDVSPGGKLPVTWPRSMGQIPLYYNHKNGGRPVDPEHPDNRYASRYIDMPNTPLYPFGYGLTYSSFTLTDLELSASTVTLSGKIEASALLSNTGPVKADEVVQLYVRQAAASVTRPVRELKAFERVTLEPGASRRVSLEVPVSALGFHGLDMKYRVEPGEFTLWLGTSSEGGLAGRFYAVP
jgi:beta-glucosidase